MLDPGFDRLLLSIDIRQATPALASMVIEAHLLIWIDSVLNLARSPEALDDLVDLIDHLVELVPDLN